MRPAHNDEVSEALMLARERDLVVRVAGAGHSFSEAVLTDGMLLSLDRMDRVLDIDGSAGMVRVQGGITLSALNERLQQEGLALPNLGDIDVQSLAGAVATATHGTGARLPNLSAGVVSLELALADGTTIEVNERDDADAWRAARVSIGALGVITALTLRTVPAFTLHAIDRPQPLGEVLDTLEELTDSNDHFEFYNFPHSGVALTRSNNRVDVPAQPRSRSREWFDDVFVVNHLLSLVCRTGRRLPGTIPRLNRLASRLAGTSERIDRSYLIFASRRDVRFTEMEYALPRENAAAGVRAVRELVERHRFSVPLPMEVRFVAADDALLSPAQGRASAYIAVHMFEGMDYEGYFRAVEEAMVSLGGRPHWGKRHWLEAGDLSELYPGWTPFASIRSRFDPGGRFTNDYVERVLGPV